MVGEPAFRLGELSRGVLARDQSVLTHELRVPTLLQATQRRFLRARVVVQLHLPGHVQPEQFTVVPERHGQSLPGYRQLMRRGGGTQPANVGFALDLCEFTLAKKIVLAQLRQQIHQFVPVLLSFISLLQQTQHLRIPPHLRPHGFQRGQRCAVFAGSDVYFRTADGNGCSATAIRLLGGIQILPDPPGLFEEIARTGGHQVIDQGAVVTPGTTQQQTTGATPVTFQIADQATRRVALRLIAAPAAPPAGERLLPAQHPVYDAQKPVEQEHAEEQQQQANPQAALQRVFVVGQQHIAGVSFDQGDNAHAEQQRDQ